MQRAGFVLMDFEPVVFSQPYRQPPGAHPGVCRTDVRPAQHGLEMGIEGLYVPPAGVQDPAPTLAMELFVGKGVKNTTIARSSSTMPLAITILRVRADMNHKKTSPV